MEKEKESPVQVLIKAEKDRKPKSDMPVPALTQQEAAAMLDVLKCEEISHVNTALIFRRMQSSIPGYARFFSILPSKIKATMDKDAPFFRVTVTEEGLKLAKKYYKAVKHNMSGITP